MDILTGITAQQKGTTAQWYSNKTYLPLKQDMVKKQNIWISDAES